MRLLHLADLHIGKILHKRSLLEDQAYILKQILAIAKEQRIDAVLIAGDVYQRSTPSPEAMTLFSDFLTGLTDLHLPCYLIAGNHDSAERVAYLSALAERSGVYIAGAEQAAVYSYPLEDDFGAVTLHLMPFLTPSHAKLHYPDEADRIVTYEDAVRTVLQHHPPASDGGRHVMVAHQFLTGAAVCESEELAIGGQDNISAALFDRYDYVALGHLHGPQRVSRETIRYAGSPLRYSFSELTQKKSVTIVELREKGNVQIETIPLHPLHGMQELTGTLAALLASEPTDDFVHVILTDEEPPADAVRQLRTVYKNLLCVTYRSSKFREDRFVEAEGQPEKMDFPTLFRAFYAFQNQGAEPSADQMKIVEKLLLQLDREAGAS
ncbi:MAG TPA: exonuclease sbcCD subunit D [Ruminococcus sp.]|nr:exonuclease sbcCD subunit D [Ruminococcus sp.]